MGERQHIRGVSLRRLYRLLRRDGEPRPPEVVFGATEAASGNYAPVALSGSGTVTIYAATKPTAAITVQSITCIKAVS